MTHLKQNIANVTSLLQTTSTQINTYISGDIWLVNDMEDLFWSNNIIYTENSDEQYSSPNPDTTR